MAGKEWIENHHHLNDKMHFHLIRVDEGGEGFFFVEYQTSDKM